MRLGLAAVTVGKDSPYKGADRWSEVVAYAKHALSQEATRSAESG